MTENYFPVVFRITPVFDEAGNMEWLWVCIYQAEIFIYMSAEDILHIVLWGCNEPHENPHHPYAMLPQKYEPQVKYKQ